MQVKLSDITLSPVDDNQKLKISKHIDTWDTWQIGMSDANIRWLGWLLGRVIWHLYGMHLFSKTKIVHGLSTDLGCVFDIQGTTIVLLMTICIKVVYGTVKTHKGVFDNGPSFFAISLPKVADKMIWFTVGHYSGRRFLVSIGSICHQVIRCLRFDYIGGYYLHRNQFCRAKITFI